MPYLLYNTDTNEYRKETENPYEVDGKPGILPDHIVELQVIRQPKPDISFNQIANSTRVLNLTNKTLTLGWDIIDVAPRVPVSITPRQLRLWLLSQNIPLSAIDDNLTTEEAKVEWRYSLEIRRDHPLVALMAVSLNLSDEQVDQAFVVASTL